MSQRRSAHETRRAFALALLAGAASFTALLTLAPPAPAADWTNQGGNAARNALTSEIGPGTATLLWSGGRSSLIAWHPVTEGNRVFMVRQPKWPYQQPDDAFIVASDLATGEELWTRVLPYNSGDWIPWIAGARDGRVYCSRSGNGASVSATMHALDAATGATVWISDDVQDAGAYDPVVFAEDGDLLVASFQDIWRFESTDGSTVWHAVRVGSVSGSCGGALFGGGFYVLDAVPGGHALRKFDAATGQFLYQSATMPGFLTQTMPFVAPDGTVLINRAENSPSNDYYYAWIDTGAAFTLKWQVPGFAGANSQQAVGPDGSIYAIIAGARLARLDGDTGAVVDWIAQPPGFSSARMACDAAGRLYFSTGGTGAGHLYVYAADLALLWDTAVDYINIGGPSIGADGTLVVANNGTDVRAYRVADPQSAPEPVAIQLRSPAPNPFAAETSIRFGRDAAGPVRLSLFDAGGRLVRTLRDETRAAGPGALTWEGRDAEGRPLPSGVYFYRLQAGGGTLTGRIVRTR